MKRAVIVVALSLLWAAQAAAVEVRGRIAETGQVTQGTLVKLEGESGDTKTATVGADGTFTADLPAGKYRLGHSGDFFWPSKRRVTIGEGGPVDLIFEGRDIRAPDVWTPPFRGFTVGPVAKSSQVKDVKLQRFSRHDEVQDLGTTFKVPTTAEGLHDRNNNITYEQTFSVYGANLNIGLPTPCECDPPMGYRFSHAVGLTLGVATYALDASSRRDQHREAFQRSGTGAAWGVDYTAVVTQTPTDSFWSRLGGRFHASWLQAYTDLDTHPHDADGLAGFNGRFEKHDGSANIQQWEFGMDALVRAFSLPRGFQVTPFVGVKLIHTITHLNSRTDVFIPGLNQVTRDDRLQFGDTQLRGRVGADMLFGQIPGLGWVVGGRVEADIGPDGMGSMFKVLVIPKLPGQ